MQSTNFVMSEQRRIGLSYGKATTRSSLGEPVASNTACAHSMLERIGTGYPRSSCPHSISCKSGCRLHIR